MVGGLAALLLHGALESTMSGQPRTRTFWARGAVIITLVLLAVVGFCIFEGDHDGDQHAGSLHGCLAMVVSSLARIPSTALLATGCAVTLFVKRLPAVTLGVAVPPPKFSFSR